MTGYLRVKNWKEWQHYKDRNPPWVKLHAKLLGNDDFQELGEPVQYQLVRVWLVASRSSKLGLDDRGREVPLVVDDEKTLRRMICSSKPIPLKRLIEAGWLIPCAASTVIAPDVSGASIEDTSEQADSASTVVANAVAVSLNGHSENSSEIDADFVFGQNDESEETSQTQDGSASTVLDPSSSREVQRTKTPRALPVVQFAARPAGTETATQTAADGKAPGSLTLVEQARNLDELPDFVKAMPL